MTFSYLVCSVVISTFASLTTCQMDVLLLVGQVRYNNETEVTEEHHVDETHKPVITTCNELKKQEKISSSAVQVEISLPPR